MNKLYLFIIVIFMFSFINADYIGKFKLNEPMEINNYCQDGNCTYVTLESIQYPNGTIIYYNINMTKNNKVYNFSFVPEQIGFYTFITCRDSITAVCDSDTFDVTFNGKESYQSINIILLIFFVFLFLGYFYLNKNIDYEKWYNSIINKYESKNYIKMTLSGLLYNLIKNKPTMYYIICFPIVIIVTEITLVYNIESISYLTSNLLYFYTWSFIIIGFLLLGQAQEFIYSIIEDIKNLNLGFGK